MKFPRDLSGDKLVHQLAPLGYAVTRQTGSHMRLTCTKRGTTHYVTIPRHRSLKVGTLRGILGEIAVYLDMDPAVLAARLFG